VINLEACGYSGKAILFQAGSPAMIRLMSAVPYPHGTVAVRRQLVGCMHSLVAPAHPVIQLSTTLACLQANDVFKTGIIVSDTDYRQFVRIGTLYRRSNRKVALTFAITDPVDEAIDDTGPVRQHFRLRLCFLPEQLPLPHHARHGVEHQSGVAGAYGPCSNVPHHARYRPMTDGPLRPALRSFVHVGR